MFSMIGGVRVELTRSRDTWILFLPPPLTSYRILGKWGVGEIQKRAVSLTDNWSKLL